MTEGHPDKLCDQISDAVLDACLEQDPRSRVACETATKTGFVMLLGEITTLAHINFDQLARKVIVDIGFDSSAKGFDGNTCAVQVAIGRQSPNIAQGVDHALEVRRKGVTEEEVATLGAGDQGMMFGFACHETELADADADRPVAPPGATPGDRCARRMSCPGCGPTASPR